MTYRDYLDASYALLLETFTSAGHKLEDAIEKVGRWLDPPITVLEQRIANAKENVRAYQFLQAHAPGSRFPDKREATV